MKKTIFAFTVAITVSATGISGYVASQPNPTQAQTNLANTANTVAIAGTTAIFGLLSNQNEKNRDS